MSRCRWSISISFMADSFSRTWRQLSLDGRGTPVKSVINALPLLLLQFPLFLLKLQLIQTGQQFFLCSPNLSIHICTPPLKHFLICCKCTQKASPILLLTTVHAPLNKVFLFQPWSFKLEKPFEQFSLTLHQQRNMVWTIPYLGRGCRHSMGIQHWIPVYCKKESV